MVTGAAGHRLGGTDESRWQQWDGWARIPELGVPTAGQRVVVVSAHPDDEVLALGGLLRRIGQAACRVVFVTASDGEASHPGSPTITPAQLAVRREHELAAALGRLGHAGSERVRLRLPDSRLPQHDPDLVDLLRPHLAGASLAVAPWLGDGHPDHEACGRATVAAAPANVSVWEYPVWAWHWASPGQSSPGQSSPGWASPGAGPLPWERARVLRLSDDERAAKAAAVACFESQIAPLSDHPQDAVVLPPDVLAHFSRPHEVVFA